MEKKYVILLISVFVILGLIGIYFLGTSVSNPISGAMTGFATVEDNYSSEENVEIITRNVIT